MHVVWVPLGTLAERNVRPLIFRDRCPSRAGEDRAAVAQASHSWSDSSPVNKMGGVKEIVFFKKDKVVYSPCAIIYSW